MRRSSGCRFRLYCIFWELLSLRTIFQAVLLIASIVFIVVPLMLNLSEDFRHGSMRIQDLKPLSRCGGSSVVQCKTICHNDLIVKTQNIVAKMKKTKSEND